MGAGTARAVASALIAMLLSLILLLVVSSLHRFFVIYRERQYSLSKESRALEYVFLPDTPKNGDAVLCFGVVREKIWLDEHGDTRKVSHRNLDAANLYVPLTLFPEPETVYSLVKGRETAVECVVAEPVKPVLGDVVAVTVSAEDEQAGKRVQETVFIPVEDWRPQTLKVS